MSTASEKRKMADDAIKGLDKEGSLEWLLCEIDEAAENGAYSLEMTWESTGYRGPEAKEKLIEKITGPPHEFNAIKTEHGILISW